MSHRLIRPAVAASLVALAFIPALSSRAAAQPTTPATAWESLPGAVAEGTAVVVRTHAGQVAAGRVRSLSDTAIVLDSGRLLTIPAMSVETIEAGRAGRRVKRGAAAGLSVGVVLGGLSAVAWLWQPHDGPCTSDDCLTGSDALFAMLFFPAAGTAIGAGVGLLIPGERRVLYVRGASGSVAVAPIAGHGRHGAQLRVAF